VSKTELEIALLARVAANLRKRRRAAAEVIARKGLP